MGLRGFLGLLLKLRTAEVDAHSGVVGGGAPNPLAGLVRVLAACFDAQTGRILIPGVLDDVRPVTDAEMDVYVRSGFDLRHMMGLLMNSRAYQLGSETRPENENDRRFYSHYLARRLPAEQVSSSAGQPMAARVSMVGRMASARPPS